MNRNDPRYASAENNLMKAARLLLRDHDIDSIRTQDIIRNAGIHKSTFYSHYRDKYALLEAIEDRAADVLYPHMENIFTNMLGTSKDPGKLDECYAGLAECIFDCRDDFSIIVRGAKISSITSKVIYRIEDIWEKKRIADPQDPLNAYLINAIAYIMIGTIEKWINRSCVDSIEDFVKLIKATGLGIQDAYNLL